MKQHVANFFRSIYGQALLFVIVFACCRWLWMFAFYSGFTGGFEKLASTLGHGKVGGLIAFKPYYSFSIFWGSLLNPVFFIVLFVSGLPFLLYKKYSRGTSFSFTRTERIFFTLVAFLVGWELATYDYNYYLNSAFYFDRIALLVLPFLLYRYPALTIIYLAFSLAYRSQFNFPADGFPLYDKRLLFDLLIACIVYQYCRMFVREYHIPVFYFVLCIVASGYFASGWKKVLISPHGYEWVVYNDPLHLFNNVHLRGWLACSSESVIHSFRGVLENFGAAFQWIILLLELCALLLLQNRRLAICLLGGFFLMHIGIFLFGSMLFWKWMAVDAVLIFILLRRNRSLNGIFTDTKLRWISLAVVLTSVWWLKPIPIGWHDTPVNQFYTYEVIGEDGKVYALDKNEMNPYHQWFQYDHFPYLVDGSVPAISGFGYTNEYSLAEALRNADSSQVAGILEEHSRVNSDTLMKNKYNGFIREYFRNRNAQMETQIVLTTVAPPHHLYSQVCGQQYTGNIRVKKFRVIRNLTFTKDNETQWVASDVINEIEIPSR